MTKLYTIHTNTVHDLYTQLPTNNKQIVTHEQTKMKLPIYYTNKKQNKLSVVHLKYCSDDVNTTYYHISYNIA